MLGGIFYRFSFGILLCFGLNLTGCGSTESDNSSEETAIREIVKEYRVTSANGLLKRDWRRTCELTSTAAKRQLEANLELALVDPQAQAALKKAHLTEGKMPKSCPQQVRFMYAIAQRLNPAQLAQRIAIAKKAVDVEVTNIKIHGDRASMFVKVSSEAAEYRRGNRINVIKENGSWKVDPYSLF